ncbi:unnamed protein product [Heterobilharzia americana]|nr:unnamed protein product [Heterobilharzia americana]CAH8487108.1 unnamed protein product [Heterobilharzia americana]
MAFSWIITILTLLCLSHDCVSTDGFRKCSCESQNLEISQSDAELLTRDDKCHVFPVESIPENLTFSSGSPKYLSTYFAWKTLINSAKKNISIASFYWSLLAEAKYNFTAVNKGFKILQSLKEKSKEISVKIVNNGIETNNTDLQLLSKSGAQVKWLDVKRLVGQGILHTKLWSVDSVHGYVGSANMDWRSITEVKELGVLIYNCPDLMKDLEKIWKVYWLLSGTNSTIPTAWPKELNTVYNRTNPIITEINGVQSRVFFSSSPLPFNPPGRNNDIDALLSVINNAEKFVYVSVMDFLPEIEFYNQKLYSQFWPVIDNALRKAAIDRSVEVRLLISRWSHSSPAMRNYLSSLRAINGVRSARVRIRNFVVPSYTEAQKRIPFARVNHNKYMVTDKTAYIGTSNWSGDYFLYTGGIAFIFDDNQSLSNPYGPVNYEQCSIPKPVSIRQQVENLFRRDWNSEFAFEI